MPELELGKTWPVNESFEFLIGELAQAFRNGRILRRVESNCHTEGLVSTVGRDHVRVISSSKSVFLGSWGALMDT